MTVAVSTAGDAKQSNLYPEASSFDDIRRNVECVRERIANACARVGRDPASVELLPVTKTVNERRIRFAHAAGCIKFGENKVQELRRKSGELVDMKASWSVIGRLQTNKAKYVARLADEFQALGSLKLAEALQRRLEIEERTLDVFVQVNSSGETRKYGLEPGDVLPFVKTFPAFDRLRVKGLMTLAGFSTDQERVRACSGACAAFKICCATRRRVASLLAVYQWACRVTSKLLSKKGRHWLALGKRYLGRAPCLIATTGRLNPASDSPRSPLAPVCHFMRKPMAE